MGNAVSPIAAPPPQPVLAEVPAVPAQTSIDQKKEDLRARLKNLKKYQPAAPAHGKTPAADCEHDYRVLLERVYQENNPTKLTEIDQLMQKYKGQEREMYE